MVSFCVQSDLSRTAAENAFVAIGSIKAMLHQEETIKFPRVVGFYIPFQWIFQQEE